MRLPRHQHGRTGAQITAKGTGPARWVALIALIAHGIVGAAFIAPASAQAILPLYFEGVQLASGGTVTGSLSYDQGSYLNISVAVDEPETPTVHFDTVAAGGGHTATTVTFEQADQSAQLTLNFAEPLGTSSLVDIETSSSYTVACSTEGCPDTTVTTTVVAGRLAGALIAPTIESPSDVSVAEGQMTAIDVEGMDFFDSEGDGLTFAKTGGDDASRFTIDADTGLVTFVTAPDFELPADVQGDNVYEVQVTLTDFGGLTAVQDITIFVSDELESSDDATAPYAVGTIVEAPNDAGWHTVPVFVGVVWVDDSDPFFNSGIDEANCEHSVVSTGEGELTLSASCQDLAGNAAVENLGTFFVDLEPPITYIGSAPGARPSDEVTVPPVDSIFFSGSDTATATSQLTYECQLDGAGFVPCVSPWQPTLVPGTVHTFDVRAVDRAGWLDPTPASHTWTSQATCNGLEVTVDIVAGQVPTEGDDVILGTTGDDIIDGLAGHDTICGHGGNDVIDGGDDRDTIITLGGNDVIEGGQGIDKIYAGAGNDDVRGDSGSDLLYGEAGDDVIRGGTGNDLIEGGAGVDELRGQNGIDVIYADTATSRGAEGGSLYGGGNTDTLHGDDGPNEMHGGAASDDLFGYGGDDQLFGEWGQDDLDGGNGSDLCDGGTRNSLSGDIAIACEVTVDVP